MQSNTTTTTTTVDLPTLITHNLEDVSIVFVWWCLTDPRVMEGGGNLTMAQQWEFGSELRGHQASGDNPNF